MKISIINESFYTNLNFVMQAKIHEVYKAHRLCQLFSIISLAFYLIINIIFIYMLKDIFFTSNYIMDLNLLFNLCKIFIVISGAIFITSYINKIPKANYTKAVNSLKELLIMDVCTCNAKCNCKNSVIIFLKKNGINLLS